MAQWVKNLTAVARVDAEVPVQSLAREGGLKNLVLPQLSCRLQLWLRFSPWPRNFHMLWAQPKQKRKQSSHRGSVETNLTSIPEDTDSIPGLAQWIGDLGLIASA